MKLIELTKGYRTKVSDVDHIRLLALGEWYACPQKNGRVYAKKKINKRTIAMHRFLMGVTDPKMDVDHKDHDGLNNMRSNLRVVSMSLNNMNARKRVGKNIRSKYKGVAYRKNRAKKWFARIHVGKQVVYLGAYSTEEEAALAYNSAALKHFGNQAYINIVD